MKKRVLLTACLFLMLFAAAGTVFAAGVVDWQGGLVLASGSGRPAVRGEHAGQARERARSAAHKEAARNLQGLILKMQVDADKKVADLLKEDEVKKAQLASLLQKAIVVGEMAKADGSYEVHLSVPLYGLESVSSLVYPRNATVLPFVAPLEEIVLVPPASVETLYPADIEQLYTGVVIDCRGLSLSPALLPLVYDEAGRPVYSYRNLNYGRAVSLGVAKYEEGFYQRYKAGSNPLIVRAVGLAEGSVCDPVLAQKDADFLLMQQLRGKFLENTAVVFLLPGVSPNFQGAWGAQT